MPVPTYNDVGLTYDEVGWLYDGLELGTPITLLVNGQDVTDYLADRGLSVRVGVHGNSRGTIDLTLIDPPFIPSPHDEVHLFVLNVGRYSGTAQTIDTEEYSGGHLWVRVGCQDEGPTEGELPSAAPFGISDNPDDVATFGYRTLRKQTRTTDGGSPQTTYEVVIQRGGVWANQNIELTSANHGLVAEEFTVNEVSVSWTTDELPEYTLILGDPIVSLAQVISDGDFIPEGSITETKISNGAITTPKLSADAVIANVANVGDTVIIDSEGVTVTDGAITVRNGDGEVVIDGNSSMFRIVADGGLSNTVGAASSAWTDAAHFVDDSVTTRGVMGWIGTTVNTEDPRVLSRLMSVVAGGAGYEILASMDVSTFFTGEYQIVRFGGFNASGSSVTWYVKYQVLSEAAI